MSVESVGGVAAPETSRIDAHANVTVKIDALKKLKAEREVLRRAVLGEKKRSEELQSNLTVKERTLRASMEEMERLTFDNQRLQKRLEVLLKDGGNVGETGSVGATGGGLFSGLISAGSGTADEMQRLVDHVEVLKQELDVKIKENEMVHMKIFETQQESMRETKAAKRIAQESETRAREALRVCEVKSREAENMARRADEAQTQLKSAKMEIDSANAKLNEKTRRFDVMKRGLCDEIRDLKDRFTERVPFDDEANVRLARWQLKPARIAFRNAILSAMKETCDKLDVLAPAWMAYAQAVESRESASDAFISIARALETMRQHASLATTAYKRGVRVSVATFSFADTIQKMIQSHAVVLDNDGGDDDFRRAHASFHAHMVTFATSLKKFAASRKGDRSGATFFQNALDGLLGMANALSPDGRWDDDYDGNQDCRARIGVICGEIHSILCAANEQKSRVDWDDAIDTWSHEGSVKASQDALHASKSYMTNLRSVVRPPRVAYRDATKLRRTADLLTAENRELSQLLASRSREFAKERKVMQAKVAEIATLRRKLKDAATGASPVEESGVDSGSPTSPSGRKRLLSRSSSSSLKEPPLYEYFPTDFSGAICAANIVSDEQAEREEEIKLFYENKVVSLQKTVEDLQEAVVRLRGK